MDQDRRQGRVDGREALYMGTIDSVQAWGIGGNEFIDPYDTP
ncbi:hypothetical protein ACFV2D_32265 [Streptomyces capillispiralis]